MGKKISLWTKIYSAVLALFTLFVLLDAFIIPRIYLKSSNSVVESESADSASSNENGAATGRDADLSPSQAAITKNSYSDENIKISITKYRKYDTDIYVADISLSSAEYLKTAFAEGVFGKNIKEQTSEIASENNAILAVNGDFYGVQNSGYVIRNGVLYRETTRSEAQEDLAIYKDGTFQIISEGSITASELIQDGAVHVFSFGPGLIENGKISVSSKDEVDKAKASNPRTAIGQIEALHYVFVVSDGRTEESAGLTLLQLAEFMQDLGVETAYNLDGGGSSTMVFDGSVVNNPTSTGSIIKERSVSDIVFIGY